MPTANPRQTAESDDCPFCAIVRGDDSSVEIVGDGPGWVAFFPLSPATPGHTLVVTREHVAEYWSLREDAASAVASGALRVGKALQRALAPKGMNLITSSGEAAEQTIEHVHLHVVPRWPDDAIGPIWPPKEPMDPALNRELGDKVRAALLAEGM